MWVSFLENSIVLFPDPFCAGCGVDAFDLAEGQVCEAEVDSFRADRGAPGACCVYETVPQSAGATGYGCSFFWRGLLADIFTAGRCA